MTNLNFSEFSAKLEGIMGVLGCDAAAAASILKGQGFVLLVDSESGESVSRAISETDKNAAKARERARVDAMSETERLAAAKEAAGQFKDRYTQIEEQGAVLTAFITTLENLIEQARDAYLVINTEHHEIHAAMLDAVAPYQRDRQVYMIDPKDWSISVQNAHVQTHGVTKSHGSKSRANQRPEDAPRARGGVWFVVDFSGELTSGWAKGLAVQIEFVGAEPGIRPGSCTLTRGGHRVVAQGDSDSGNFQSALHYLAEKDSEVASAIANLSGWQNILKNNARVGEAVNVKLWLLSQFDLYEK